MYGKRASLGQLFLENNEVLVSTWSPSATRKILSRISDGTLATTKGLATAIHFTGGISAARVVVGGGGAAHAPTRRSSRNESGIT